VFVAVSFLEALPSGVQQDSTSVSITSVKEIDDEVKHWLKVAYELDA
jgi:hypothetical protein